MCRNTGQTLGLIELQVKEAKLHAAAFGTTAATLAEATTPVTM